MKTSQYFIDEEPLQIIFLDNSPDEGRFFFDRGLGTVWFDYDLHLMDDIDKVFEFIDSPDPGGRNPDLLLISNDIWSKGGEQLVAHVRLHPTLSRIPVYCVISCDKIRHNSNHQCWDFDWRIETNCDEDARLSARPLQDNLANGHPSRIDGTICANNIATEIPKIIDNMTSYWFHSAK